MIPASGTRGPHYVSVISWGTVENLAPSSCDVAAGPCINTLAEEVRPGEAFITFGGPQGHDDRMASCGGLATRLLAVARNPPHKSARQRCVHDTLGALIEEHFSFVHRAISD